MRTIWKKTGDEEEVLGMRWARKIVCIGVAVSLLVALAGGAAAADSKKSPWEQGLKLGILKKIFDDEDEAPWATGYMAKMKLNGLMQGYPGGKFMPNIPISRVELVVLAVRVKGLEEEARARNGAVLPFGDSESIYRKYPWAVGYLATAAGDGLIPSDRSPFHPEKPASRLWAAEVLIKAMGLQDEAEDMMDAVLPYRDANEIPDDKVGYVALALERGIMMGDGNSFRPNASIRRCEVAAVLDRLQEALPPLGYEVRGVITGVNESGRSITLRVFDNKWWNARTSSRATFTGSVYTGTVTISVSVDALILVDKKLADIDDLEAGYRVTVLRNSAGKAVLVDAQSGGKTPNWPDPGVVTKEGEVTEVVLGASPRITIEDNRGAEWSYAVAPNCEITKDGDEIDLDEVDVGDEVSLRIINSKVTKIIVEESVVESEKDGKVTDIRLTTSPKRITIKMSNGATFTAAISSDVVVKSDGASARLEDIHVGDEVHLDLRDGYVIRIDIEESVAREYEGFVKDIYSSGSSRRITLRLDGTGTMSVTVSPDVVVKYDGAIAALGDVMVGDKVKVTVVDSLATRIEIFKRSVLARKGVVTQVETGTSARIWVRVSGGSVENYAVAADADIEYKDDALELEDIVPGDTVEIKITDSKVTSITVTDRPASEVTGVIEALNPSSTLGRMITVKTSTSQQLTYRVSGDAIIKKGASLLSFGDLKEGDKVVLNLAGNLVVKVTVEQ